VRTDEALRMLAAAAADADANMRDDDGRCLDCGHPRGVPHDDPDCGMASLEVWREVGRGVLRDAREAAV
jgi:hypothetical protein